MKTTDTDGRIDRRAAFGFLGSMAALVLVGCGDDGDEQGSESESPLTFGASPRALSCVVRPDQTEGPFFVDEHLLRSDLVAADPNEPGVQRGVPLTLRFGAFTVGGNSCAPLVGATIDIWHADADGIYSDVFKPSIQPQDTRGRRFLRAYQVTDERGQVEFKTIYPGAYAARTIHIHFKVRAYSADGNMTSEFTSQIYFDDLVSDRIAYNRNRRVRNRNDGIYRDGGDRLMLDLVREEAGYLGTFNLGLRAT